MGSREPSLSVCTFSLKPVLHIPAHVYQDRQEKARTFQFPKPTPPGDVKASLGCADVPSPPVAVLPLCPPAAPAAPQQGCWTNSLEMHPSPPIPPSAHPGHDPHLKAPQHPKLHETLDPTL